MTMKKINCTKCAALIDGYVPFPVEDSDELLCHNCWDMYQEVQQDYYEPSESDEWASFDPDC